MLPAFSKAILVVAIAATGAKSAVGRDAPRIHVETSIVPAEGVLSRNDLVAIARAGRVPVRDEFAVSPTLKFAGRQFSVRVGPSVAYGLAHEYDAGKQELYIYVMDSSRFTLSEHLRSGKSYVGENVAGVSARVERINADSVFLIVPNDKDETGVMHRGSLGKSIKLSGNEARAVWHDTNLEIKGRLAQQDGCVGSSKAVSSNPTMDAPISLKGRECQIFALVEKVSAIRTSTGEVLAEWKPKLTFVTRSAAAAFPPPSSFR